MDPTGGGPRRGRTPTGPIPGADWRAERPVRASGLFALVFAAYGAGLLLTWHSFGATVGPAFFPAAGVTVAAMLLVRRAQWPVVLAAIALAECLIDLYFGEPFPQILGHVLANWLVPVVGATVVLRWCKGRPDLPRRRDLTAFLVGACLIGPLAGGMLGGWATSWDGEATWLANALYWAFGDALGVLVVATPIPVVARPVPHPRGPTGGDRRRSGRHRCAVGHRLLPRGSAGDADPAGAGVGGVSAEHDRRSAGWGGHRHSGQPHDPLRIRHLRRRRPRGADPTGTHPVSSP